MTDDPTFKIPKEVIEPIIQAHVNKAVTEALGGSDQIVSRTIAFVLNIKVNDQGNPSNYSSDLPFLTWAMQKTIKEAVLKMMQEEFSKHGEALRQHLIAELSKSKSPLVKNLVDAMTGIFTDKDNLKWRLKISYGE